mmetsp:Transcript_32320/g.44398  ORF Transcript_32320/g.44398 Transcript_32320/m.44398 type:complete len:83 (+) Transcript_32320:49-297(+)
MVLNPKPFLKSLIGKRVIIRLKWGMQYVGHLISTDEYMNIHLTECSEYIGNALQGYVGEVLIRCNNVLTVRSGEEDSAVETS